MSYIALYRKFRPQTFDQVKGQDHVVRALKNQLINKRIGHAYLFTGTRGTGKTSAAKIFAKAINCLHPVNGEPCNECENCKAVNAGNFVDVVEVDAASNNGVDDIRRIIEEIRYTPVKGAYKVFIIDEAHMITGAAFNAFLKTLEEPPSYAVFILATTEPHKLPITILSRCQRYDFRRITTEQISGNLAEIVHQEGVEADEKALRYIARIGDGSMRDSISLLDKCIAFNLGEKLTYENVLDTLGTVDTDVFSRMFRGVYAGDVPTALSIIDETVAEGRDLTQFTTDLIWYLRNILMAGVLSEKDLDLLGLSAENMAQLNANAAMADSSVLMRYIRILSELLNQIKFSSSKQVLLEIGIIKLARPQMETDTDSLADRIRQLEAGLSTCPSSGYALGNKPQPAMQQQMPRQPERQTVKRFDMPTEFPEEDDFFGGLAASERMTDPNAFADLFDDGVQITYNGSPELMKPQNAPAQTVQAAPQAQTLMNTGGQDLTALWPELLKNCTDRRIKITLGKCTVNQVGEDLLKIYAASEFALKQLKDESAMAWIKQFLSQAAGREIEVQAILAGTEPLETMPQSAFPEEYLNNINFQIGTEER